MRRTGIPSGRSVAVSLLFALWSPAIADDGVDVRMELERIESATTAELTSYAETAEAGVKKNVQALEDLDKNARKQSKDGEGLQCVTSNLSAAQSLYDVTKTSRARMLQALGEGNEARARSEVVKISIAAGKSGFLVDEAERCALGSGVQEGRVGREATGGSTNADDDVRGSYDDPLDYGFDPTSASPF